MIITLYLLELQHGRTDRQTYGLTNLIHKQFSTLLESVKNENVPAANKLKDCSAKTSHRLDWIINIFF